MKNTSPLTLNAQALAGCREPRGGRFKMTNTTSYMQKGQEVKERQHEKAAAERNNDLCI